MDALSDVLRVVRMKGGVFLRAAFGAPWCVSSRVGPEDCSRLVGGADHLVLYHYVVEGRLVAKLAGGAPVEIAAGQVFMLPHNDEHLLGSHLDRPPVPTRELVVVPQAGEGLWEIRHGGDGERTLIMCGFLGCERVAGNPLIESLPPMLTFDARHGSVGAWIRFSLEYAADEIRSGRAGGATVLAKLSELLFVEAVRRHVDGLPPEQTGWLAGLRDPVVSRALAFIHRRVAEDWTVDDLARAAGLSRSALADRFTRLVGEPPMHYLARWRIQVAANLLRGGDAPLARIAEQVGYESEAAFSRAFKRSLGMPPAAWRRAARP